MEEKEKSIKCGLTLTKLTLYLNENFKKRSGRRFTTSDVQQYINITQHLPKYLGKYRIDKDTSIDGVSLYNIVEIY
jgi:hypothetical protein